MNTSLAMDEARTNVRIRKFHYSSKPLVIIGVFCFIASFSSPCSAFRQINVNEEIEAVLAGPKLSALSESELKAVLNAINDPSPNVNRLALNYFNGFVHDAGLYLASEYGLNAEVYDFEGLNLRKQSDNSNALVLDEIRSRCSEILSNGETNRALAALTISKLPEDTAKSKIHLSLISSLLSEASPDRDRIAGLLALSGTAKFSTFEQKHALLIVNHLDSPEIKIASAAIQALGSPKLRKHLENAHLQKLEKHR